jgi:hypothetical protein
MTSTMILTDGERAEIAEIYIFDISDKLCNFAYFA